MSATGPTAGKGRAARVRRLENLSDQRLAVLALDGTDNEIIAALPPEVRAAAGDNVTLRFRRVLWFDAQGVRVRT